MVWRCQCNSPNARSLPGPRGVVESQKLRVARRTRIRFTRRDRTNVTSFVARSFTVGFVASGNWGTRCGCDGSSPSDTDVCFDDAAWNVAHRDPIRDERGQRIGEAKNPGPGSQRRRTQRLRALQRALDSDSESDAESAQGWSLPGVERCMWRPVCQSRTCAQSTQGCRHNSGLWRPLWFTTDLPSWHRKRSQSQDTQSTFPKCQ